MNVEIKKDLASNWFKTLQNAFCDDIKKFENNKTQFKSVTWKRNLKKDNFFTICLANTYDGYVVPSNEMKKGGYETWRARSSFLKDGSENDIKMAMLQLSKDL